MLHPAGFGDRDSRRLEQSLFLSLLLWTILLFVLGRIALREPGLPTDTMNPLQIELAPPAAPRESEPAKVGGAATDRTGTAGESAAPRSRADAAAPSAPQPQLRPQLRPDPGAAALPAVPRSTGAPYQGGADPFAPLSERSLAAEAPAAPVPTPAPAARTQLQPGRGTSAPVGAPGADRFDQAAGQVAGRLAAAGAAGAGAAGAAGAGTAGTTASGTAAASGGGDLGGQFDFGEGAARELWSPRRIRIPDKLLAGQPDRLETQVSFTIEPLGTVLPSTIRFDPPLPAALADYLRTAFGSWIFSPGDSDGQVRFRYSIKVR